jgi:glycosyltransferase involved in cell wall biosynthesis
MKQLKVFLTGGDHSGWALDEDMRLTQEALRNIVELTDFEHCDVVHSVWWEPLLALPTATLAEKVVLCHMSGEPFRYVSLPRYRHVVRLVDSWIAQTHEAAGQCSSISLPYVLVPYTTDVGRFRRLSADDPSVQALRDRWNIPRDRYLIGNFHRDSAGYDLTIPKRVKGPDILAEIIRALHRRQCPMHLVLAGPRRHWLRTRLDQWGIPYTFVGQLIPEDDYEQNLLPHDTLNTLYNLLDLYVVSSRSEGGPRSSMEAAAAQCKIISTRVGLAEDLLSPACLYSSPVDAAAMIEQDMATNILAKTVGLHFDRVIMNHRPEAVAQQFQSLYLSIQRRSGAPKTITSVQTTAAVSSQPTTLIRRVRSLLSRNRFRVCLWHKFFAPPYGGGNQFMLALRKGLERRGIDVLENQLRDDVDVYLLNSVHFDVDRFLEFSQRHRVRVVHRIDGPIHLIRGFDREKDELCFELNKRFASATVLQSSWTYQKIAEMSYQPIRPVIIRNAVDPDIFHPRGRVSFDPSRKIRLIATSWSNNARKGGPVYKWLEERLDWDRFEFTFVGNISVPFERIRTLPAVASDQLAELLRQHDIYLTASQNDPCSNAVIEALACGLPVLYRNEGGHPELVGFGGLPFSDVEELLPQLDKIANNYELFQRLIAVPTMDDVAEKYLTLLREAAA